MIIMHYTKLKIKNMIKILSKIVNGAKGGVVAALEGVTDVSTTTIKAVNALL